MKDVKIHLQGNIERFSGFADAYDKFRPAPPAKLSGVLTRLAMIARPTLVVDLGSGTGLSTRYWANKADRVIGIEPTEDMRQAAIRQTQAKNIIYQEGYSHQTSLPDRCAQIITCSQSLHWMEPDATFQEVRRILQPGGVFAAFDYDWPPTTGRWEVDAAYEACMVQVSNLENSYKNPNPAQKWEKSSHLERMQASGCFRYAKEIVLHQVDQGNAERLVGLLLSQGGVMTLLKAGFTESQLGIDRFRELTTKVLGSHNQDWYWSSRVRLGIV